MPRMLQAGTLNQSGFGTPGSLPPDEASLSEFPWNFLSVMWLLEGHVEFQLKQSPTTVEKRALCVLPC